MEADWLTGVTPDGRVWSVRPTLAGDVPALVSLVDGVAAEGRWLLVQPGQRTALEEHLLLAQVRAGGGLSLSLVLDGEVAGRSMVLRETQAEGVPRGEVAIILAAAARGLGLGRALLGQAVRWSRGCGLATLRLRVLPDNMPARALYSSLGFVDAGKEELRDAHAAHGHRELLAMTLDLGGPPSHPLVS